MKIVNSVAEALEIRALTVGSALHGGFWQNEARRKNILSNLDAHFYSLDANLNCWASKSNELVVVLNDDNSDIDFYSKFSELPAMVNFPGYTIKARNIIMEDEAAKAPWCTKRGLMDQVYTVLSKKTTMPIMCSASLSDEGFGAWKKMCSRRQYWLVKITNHDDDLRMKGFMFLDVLDSKNFSDIVEPSGSYSKDNLRILIGM
jgi:hypothetical protein